jgi:hypothetical protein
MKKHAATLLIAMFGALTGMMYAQSKPTIKAEVPFEYVAAGKVMPAGESTIKIEGDGQDVLLIMSGKQHLFAIPNASESHEASKMTSLVFHKYGDRYFLAGINRGGENRGYELPVGKLEAELRAQNVAEHDVTLLASLQ